MFVSIGQAAALIGVSISTLRRWELENKFLPDFRTIGGHRRYRIASIEQKFLKIKPQSSKRKNFIYARVSSADQKLDLKRQILTLKRYCKQHKLSYSLISDLGSGINYNKRELNRLIDEICSGQVKNLILTHRDRLLRFGSPLLFKLCEFHGTKVVLLNDKKSTNFEEELVKDVIELMTVFCSRIYGHRSHENRLRQQKAA